MAAADHGAWRAKIYWQSILASWSVGSNHRYIDCLMQYCSISSVSAMEILQYYTKPSTCILHNREILTICIIEFCCGNAYVWNHIVYWHECYISSLECLFFEQLYIWTSINYTAGATLANGFASWLDILREQGFQLFMPSQWGDMTENPNIMFPDCKAPQIYTTISSYSQEWICLYCNHSGNCVVTRGPSQ